MLFASLLFFFGVYVEKSNMKIQSGMNLASCLDLVLPAAWVLHCQLFSFWVASCLDLLLSTVWILRCQLFIFYSYAYSHSYSCSCSYSYSLALDHHLTIIPYCKSTFCFVLPPPRGARPPPQSYLPLPPSRCQLFIFTLMLTLTLTLALALILTLLLQILCWQLFRICVASCLDLVLPAVWILCCQL